ncbi:hypothetical protein Cni_G12212 [Canna indica]|uniref:Uncharacterized protein n=1 Tax=Canna indica TaxID=4628 RepID=A0AAQ3K7P1_9LILI|nr:hypothetical protein Cni_G12212 [Canna indica]
MSQSQVLMISSPAHNSISCCSSANRPSSPSSSFLRPLHGSCNALLGSPNPGWTALQKQLRCQGRHSCLFADNRKQEQARKALESALGEKTSKFEQWSKEIEKRQEKDGGGASGRGGWFGGGGGWFGWFGGENFWEEAQQAILTILGIVSLYLLIAKGNVMFAVIFNSLLYVLRGMRNWISFTLSFLSRRNIALESKPVPVPNQTINEMHHSQMSAKERVIKKWAMD